MNDFAITERTLLQDAARALARDLVVVRAKPLPDKWYAELLATLQARLAAVTRARIVLGRWLRQNPNATREQVRRAMRELHVPGTTSELRKAIQRIGPALPGRGG